MNQVDIARQLIEAPWNQGNLGVFYQLTSPDLVSHDPLDGEKVGQDSQAAFVRGMKQVFPDVSAHIDEQIEDGDTVSTRVTFTGTHKGILHLPGDVEIAATHRTVTVPVTIHYRFEDGVVVESTADWDPDMMLAQIVG